MDAITSQIRDFYARSDEEGRRKLQDELRDVQASFDTDFDVVARLGSGFMHMSLVKTGADLHMFQMLSAGEESFSLDHLASETGAARGLLGHLLRAFAAFGLIKETGKDEFAANRTTKILADVNVSGAIEHAFELHGKCHLVLPAYLKERKYQNISSNHDLAFQKAFNTNLTPFEWLKQRPEQMKSLGHAMAIQRPVHWIESYDIEKEVSSTAPAPDSALLVDVGGGFGQQAIAFKNKFPSLPGRIIVQDIPETLDRAPATEGIEFMVQDFFSPQEVKDAKLYYLRHVLHDWTDEDCVKILKNIAPAMGPESRVVIDEVVLPDMNVPWQAAYMDITMMASLGGFERTRGEYESLLDQAGLRIVDIHRYDAKMQSVILAATKL
ncbi:S-adenosyl-L-methionine-dependent methyltransferase [Lojkania enalia]|uniref:S-adenosyl-L-methionine-dependent methyltransferase n=1 Tax=Lojkania enalia TaxID=147567 RepID=A0A9P4KJ75_9PLEO|nr:S-adenosyl-L-methionine-dependent methyltransferase [Didymosphaeria enalia]